MTDFESHLVRQMVFSKATFGPGARTDGVLDHIKKEIEEVRSSGGDTAEWVDLVILSLDGLTREIWSATQYHLPADEVAKTAVAMIVGKQGRNERRTWPYWRTADPNKAIEHVRGGDHD